MIPTYRVSRTGKKKKRGVYVENNDIGVIDIFDDNLVKVDELGNFQYIIRREY